MKLKHPFVLKSLGLLGSIVLRFWRRTIDWRAVYFDRTVDTVHPGHSGRFVYAGWHEFIVMPIALRGSQRMLALASDHADGEIITRIMHHLSWGVTRGSSKRGGVRALMHLLHEDARHLNLTPDGPRGPRRQMSLGPITLASKLEIPLVCVGYGYDRPWRFNSWDRFAVPRPFSRARAVFGPSLRVPAKLSRDGLEQYRQWFEDLLNWLTEAAEVWAESGRPKRDSLPMRVKETPLGMEREPAQPTMKLPPALVQRWAALPESSRVARDAA